MRTGLLFTDNQARIIATKLLRSRWHPWAGGLLLALATVFIYQPVWHAGFIWDDDSHLTQNPCIVGPAGFKAIWTTSEATYYPLVLTSFWVLHALWGLNPLPYHLVNVAVHAACAVLLWRVLRRLRARGAWLGAALWALHPVQAESVAWVTELKNTQSCLFYLLAILFFLRWRKDRPEAEAGASRYVLILVCAALAILSKSSTVMLPIILGICGWWLDGRWDWRNLRWIAPLLALSLAASAWTIWEQKFHSGAVGVEWAQSWPDRFIISGRAIWFYLGKLVWPHPLIFIYPQWKIDALQPVAYLPLLAAAGSLLALWRGRREWTRAMFFAFACFGVSLFPVLGFFNVYFFRFSFVSDHFQYLAAMGPLALAGAGIATALGLLKGRHALWGPVLCAGLLGVMAVNTWRQCAVYADVQVLYHTTIALNPDAWMAYNNLGSDYLQKGQIDEAIAYYRKALAIKPDYAQAHYNLGNAFLQTGRLDEADIHYRSALELQPDYSEAQSNLGGISLQKGLLDEAFTHFQKALKLQPDDPQIYNNLSNVLLQQERPEEAAFYLRKALQIQPDNADAHYSLGNAFLQRGRLIEAALHYQQALKIRPDYAQAHNNLGNVFLQQGRLSEAVAQLQSALKIRPDLSEAHGSLGDIYLQQGQMKEATLEYQAVLGSNPNNINAQNNLAWVMAVAPDANLRDGRRAIELARLANQLSGENKPLIFRTLAAAYAETGRFTEAAATAQKAIQLADEQGSPELSANLQAQLQLYQTGTPLRNLSEAEASRKSP